MSATLYLMMRQKLFIKPEKPIHGTNVAFSVKANWKHLPPVLYTLKYNDCSIQKAKYWQEWTTMYIRSPNYSQSYITDMIKSTTQDTTNTLVQTKLPFNTSIYMYNISVIPYTILDFGCIDKTGLFCNILEVLAKYDIEVEGAYINTIGNVVSNIFYITHNGKNLTDDYIEYIRNNLESDIGSSDNSY